jgi:hypothetical protein
MAFYASLHGGSRHFFLCYPFLIVFLIVILYFYEACGLRRTGKDFLNTLGIYIVSSYVSSYSVRFFSLSISTYFSCNSGVFLSSLAYLRIFYIYFPQFLAREVGLIYDPCSHFSDASFPAADGF